MADVMRRWIEEVNLDEIHGLTGKSRPLLRERLGERAPVPIDRAVGVWCASGSLRGSNALLNIVCTATDGSGSASPPHEGP